MICVLPCVCYGLCVIAHLFGSRVFRHLTLCMVGFIHCVSAHAQLIDGCCPRACAARVGLLPSPVRLLLPMCFHEVGMPHPRCACFLESDDITSIGNEGGTL